MSVILTTGSVPKFTAAQLKIKRISNRMSKRQRDLMKPAPVTVIVARPTPTPAAA